MTDIQFRSWLDEEVAGQRMLPSQRDDLLDQKGYFDRNRAGIQQNNPNEVVGYVDGTQVTGRTVHEVLRKARQQYSGKMVYFEPVGFNLF